MIFTAIRLFLTWKRKIRLGWQPLSKSSMMKCLPVLQRLFLFPVSSYHMTLYDLSSGSRLSSLMPELESNHQKLKHQLAARSLFSPKIKMRSSFIFNMVDTSLVMGLVPDREVDYVNLMSLYRLVDGVMPLHYPFTPHVILAYYNADGFSAEEARKLKKLVAELNKCSVTVPWILVSSIIKLLRA